MEAFCLATNWLFRLRFPLKEKLTGFICAYCTFKDFDVKRYINYVMRNEKNFYIEFFYIQKYFYSTCAEYIKRTDILRYVNPNRNILFLYFSFHFLMKYIFSFFPIFHFEKRSKKMVKFHNRY